MENFFAEGKSISGVFAQVTTLQKALLNTIQDLVFVMRVDEGPVFRYVYVNERAMKHAALDETCYGKTFQEVLTPDKEAKIQYMYEQAVKKNEPLVMRDEVQLPDGKMEYYESAINPIELEDGECYVVCITRDVTDWTEKQEELLDSQMRYLSLLKYNSDVILSLDQSGHVIYANPAVQQVFGYTEEEAKGCSFAEFLHPQYVPEFQRILAETLQGKSISLQAHQCEHRSGRKMYVDMKTVPIVVHHEIKGMYLIIRDVTQQLLNEWKTEYFAYYDQLTGVLNRISLSKRFSELLATAQPFALFMVNLNEFRSVNEAFGHEEGDRILQEAAERIRTVITGENQLFRRHGNQFVLITEECGPKQVQQKAEAVLKVMQHAFLVRGEEVQMKTSIGIACSPADGTDEQTLMKRADMALEKAREQGSGQYQFYEAQFDIEREHLFMLEAQLNRAVERGEFALYYQPQVHILTGKVIGWEALLRWTNREFGLVSPAQFIPLAERTGSILQIDEWVLREACRQIRTWLDEGFAPAPVSVNISAGQFRSVRIVSLVHQALEQYNIPSELLVLEITEGALIREKQAEHILRQLRQMGVGIHLDDFGTGYSSLSYLKHFPINALKIDRSFMNEVAADERDAKITTAIIHLARTLGVNVIAEGVETAQQVQFLKQEQAWYAQGYYFNKPLPAAEVERLYLQENREK